MQRKLPLTLLNPISLLGGTIAIFSLVIILVLLALGATGAIANPYTGILTFLLGPAALVFGLILIPIGAMRERRRLAKLGIVAKALPLLDLNDPRQRRGIVVFAAATAAVLSLMAVTTWGAAEFMDSKQFCGDICHRVMQPEAAAYDASAHARVSCTSCHIGPRASWLVKSKVSGIRQVFNYTFNLYQRPTAAPITDLRPSRDTCEQCHWPQQFYGNQVRTTIHYAQDEKNTPSSQSMVFRVGGSAQGQGIHWHTSAKVYYLPSNEDRSEIGWVRVEKPDGSVDEYVNPGQEYQVTPARIQSDQRFMDCIDCHNRAAHSFPPIEDSVDKAMALGKISPSIPFIKQQAMMAVGDPRSQLSQEQYQETLQRIDGVEGYYSGQQAQAYSQYGPQIKQAVAELGNIYRGSVFPDMKVAPGTYPDWSGHEGCFRCHGKLVGVSGEVAGKTIGADCQTCHYPAPAAAGATSPSSQPPAASTATATSSGPMAVPHPVQGREQCTTCHTPGDRVSGPRAGRGCRLTIGGDSIRPV
ncbi:MAG: NapC/NirT family cytochrome c [Chloroflexi bacterium]|nr:NapC/NirT family cytochrome c [Chloroflexota bacterium]